MSNRLPRALLADIAAVIGSGDHASALMMLGDESGPEASAAVSSYRAQCAAALGNRAMCVQPSVKHLPEWLGAYRQ